MHSRYAERIKDRRTRETGSGRKRRKKKHEEKHGELEKMLHVKE